MKELMFMLMALCAVSLQAKDYKLSSPDGSITVCVSSGETLRWSEPMSQGTRCRQLAEYVVFDAPFTMLCDSPSNYMAEPECTSFIASVPTVWDETLVQDGRIGEYIVIARRSGALWYLAALTDWNERDVTFSMPVDSGNAVLWRDGMNAHRNGQDYKRETVSFTGGTLTVHLAPGGGCVLQIL